MSTLRVELRRHRHDAVVFPLRGDLRLYAEL
jgi:hypothetical protein